MGEGLHGGPEVGEGSASEEVGDTRCIDVGVPVEEGDAGVGIRAWASMKNVMRCSLLGEGVTAGSGWRWRDNGRRAGGEGGSAGWEGGKKKRGGNIKEEVRYD